MGLSEASDPSAVLTGQNLSLASEDYAAYGILLCVYPRQVLLENNFFLKGKIMTFIQI